VHEDAPWAERFARQLHVPRMVREKQDLDAFGQLPQDLEGGAGSLVVEVQEHIVEHERHGFVAREVALEARQPEREVELILRALTQARDLDLGAIVSHAQDDLLVERHAQRAVLAQREPRKQERGRGQHRPLMAIAVARDFAG
jgi:hypothetical protein